MKFYIISMLWTLIASGPAACKLLRRHDLILPKFQFLRLLSRDWGPKLFMLMANYVRHPSVDDK